jgi:hypothetical protein
VALDEWNTPDPSPADPNARHGVSPSLPASRIAFVIVAFIAVVVSLLSGGCESNDPIPVVNKPPTTPANPSPADNATGQPVSIQLSWDSTDPEGGALTFDLYFGDTDPPPELETDLASSDYLVSSLDFSAVYYWKIVATDKEGLSTGGPVWTFTTGDNQPATAPTDPSPADAATTVPVDQQLGWTASTDPESGPVTYDVYLDQTDPPGLEASGVAQNSYDPGGLQYGVTYYWQIVAVDDYANRTPSSVWSFTTEPNNAPAKPSNPAPADGADAVAVNVSLSWQASDPEGDPLTYDVFFGTSSNPPNVITDHGQTTYNLQPLQYGETYYWKIVAKDDHQNQTEGDVWSFSTAAGVWNEESSPTTENLNDVWAVSPTSAFAVGNNGTILEYNGTDWSPMTSGTGEDLRGVWASASNNAIAVGGLVLTTTLLHFDGANWTPKTSPVTQAPFAVWGSSPSNVFAVCGNKNIIYFDGSSWSSMLAGTTPTLYGVWGSSGTNVFAVGASGMILQYAPPDWNELSSGTTSFLRDVWGSSADDVYAVGDGGTVRHWNGSSWGPVTAPTSGTQYGVWGSAADDVFVVGVSGRIVHFNGATWSTMSSGVSSTLYGIWGTNRGNVFVVGAGGTILRYGPP